MLFDFGILGSYLIMAILIYINQLLLKWSDNKINPQEETRGSLKNYDLALRSYFLLFSIAIILRLIFLFLFPTETLLAGIKLNITKWFFVWLIIQFCILASYAFLLVLTALHYRLKEGARFEYLSKIFRIVRSILYLDIFILFGFYFHFVYFFMTPDPNARIDTISIQTDLTLNHGLTALISLLVFSLGYLVYKRKRNLWYLKLHGIVFLITLIINIYLSLIQIKSYFLAFSHIEFLSLQNGFYGWLWLLLVVLSIFSFILILIIQRMKEGFINIQFYLNMLIFSLQFNYICTSGLIIVALIPITLKIIFN